MAKPKDDDSSLRRLGGGRWQTRDERFTIEPQSGTWVVVDAEETDDLGLPLVRGPFPSLTAAKDAITGARSGGPSESPLPARAERLRPPGSGSVGRSAPTSRRRASPSTTSKPRATADAPREPSEPEPTARVIAGMTMSLDGFVVDRNGSVERLYSDFADLRDSAYMTELQAETGAVLMGRRTFEMADDPDAYAESYEFHVPIFVVTHKAPKHRPREGGGLTFTFVTDGLASAVRQARVAADARAVTVVGGIEVIRQLLRAELVDELRLDVMPVVLAGGRRLFGEGELATLGLRSRSAKRHGARVSLHYDVDRTGR
jgi:dihydrofolate reductase